MTSFVLQWLSQKKKVDGEVEGNHRWELECAKNPGNQVKENNEVKSSLA